MNNKLNKFILFLIGCFAITQIRIIGYIGISELVLFVLAPYFCIRDWNLLSQHGFTPLIVLSIGCFVGGGVSNYVNRIDFYDAARGMAAPYAIFSIIVCLHHFLYRNIFNVKWLILGCAVSGVVSVFVFQYGAARGETSDGEFVADAESIEHVVSYSLFWFTQFDNWLNLPMKFDYLKIPFVYIVGVSIFMPLFALLSAGGRSAFLTMTVSYALIFVGGRKQKTMLRIRKYFWLLVVLGLLGGGVVKKAYQYAATAGYMGETQLRKYEKQSSRGSGALALLMAGRVDFFAGLTAAIDRPVVGYGSWALDKDGYYERFLSKYGTDEDYELFMSWLKSGNVGYLPGHSNVITAWNWYGIFGLLFWMYVFYLYCLTIRKNLAVVPQWFGYFALVLPGAMWNLFFSPFGQRIPACLVFILCAFVKAIAEKRMLVCEEKTIRGICKKGQYFS